MKFALTSMCLAALATATLTTNLHAQVFDESARAADIQNHFDISDHFGRDGGPDRTDAMQRALQRGADPMNDFRFHGGFGGGYGLHRDGVNFYGSPNYFRQFGGGYYGDGAFPGTWYFQNRRFITPYGGLYRNPSDRYFAR